MPPTHQRFKDLMDFRISLGLDFLSYRSFLSYLHYLCLAPWIPSLLAAWLPGSLAVLGSLAPSLPGSLAARVSVLAPWLPGGLAQGGWKQSRGTFRI